MTYESVASSSLLLQLLIGGQAENTSQGKKGLSRMKGFQTSQLEPHGSQPSVRASLRKYWLTMPAAILGLTFTLTAQAQNSAPLKFNLTQASDQIAQCLPAAETTITVFPKEDIRGVDTFDLKAKGMPPNTEFTVFLTQGAGPIGDVEYIGDFTTNAAGRGSMRVDAIIQEAFSSAVFNGVRQRNELRHVVIWFADPAADDFCFGLGGGPVTTFDGDGVAGAAVMSSKNFLPGAPLSPAPDPPPLPAVKR